MLGERWKALTPAQREPYEQKAKADKERYDAEKANYQVCLIQLLSRVLEILTDQAVICFSSPGVESLAAAAIAMTSTEGRLPRS